MSQQKHLSLVLATTLMAGCMAPPPVPDDPYYAPVLPRTPLPIAQNNGAIFQSGFETDLYTDRKAFRVGDVITINLAERTQASKKADADMSKDSTNSMGLTSLFGSPVSISNPTGGNVLSANNLNLDVGYTGNRATEGESEANQSNSLTGSITVTVSEVLPNGLLVVRGEKWLTLNTGNELIRIGGMVRADDIQTDNTVSSTRVANARITYSGTGAFAATSQPGWLDQFFLSPYYPC